MMFTVFVSTRRDSWNFIYSTESSTYNSFYALELTLTFVCSFFTLQSNPIDILASLYIHSPVQTAGLQRAINGAANVDAWAKVATLTDKAAEPWEIAEFTLDVIRNRYINGSALLIDAGMNAAA